MPCIHHLLQYHYTHECGPQSHGKGCMWILWRLCLASLTYVVVVDLYSIAKWPEVWEISHWSALISVSLYGLPEQLIVIMGPSLNLKTLLSSCIKACGVKHYRSAVYHPAKNRIVERFIKLTWSPSWEVLIQIFNSTCCYKLSSKWTVLGSTLVNSTFEVREVVDTRQSRNITIKGI